MRSYTLARRLSHADVDFLGELKVPALLGLLEQAAVEASSAAGYDAVRYARDGRIWIIRRTRLERLVPVGGTETVAVETQVADFRRARSLRRYAVRRDHVTVAQATTDWVYCDVHSGRPARVPADLQQAFMDGTVTETLARAAPLTMPDSDAAEFAVCVQPSHLDHVAHVNNAVYAAYLEDAAFACFAARGWPLTRMLAAGGALRVTWLDVEYLKDALAQDTLTVRTWQTDADESGGAPPQRAQVLQTIVRADGTPVLHARTDWQWRRRPAVIGGVPEP